MTDHLKILSLILFKESNIEQLLVYSPNFHVSAHSYVRERMRQVVAPFKEGYHISVVIH